MATVKFSRPNDDFFATLRNSVQQYFDENKLRSSGNRNLYLKAIILLTTYVSIYVIVMVLPVPMWVAALIAAAIGVLQALIGFNIMHDACHGSFSSRKRINYFFGLSVNALGSDAFMWRQKHNLVHHTYTNVDGVDDDIAKSPLLRMSESQPRYKAHRFQHIYLTFLYGLSTLFWIVLKDFQHYFGISGYNIETGKMKVIEHLMFWSSKMVYFGLYLVLPMLVWGVGPAIVGFIIMHAFLGLVMSFVFQLAHVVENVEFEHHHGQETMIENEWAVHQISTTSDFAMNSKVATWLLGGLNFQVEHHLFPLISHVHYPAIQQIVSKVCADYGVEYRSYQTMRAAVRSHFRHMKRLGQAA